MILFKRIRQLLLISIVSISALAIALSQPAFALPNSGDMMPSGLEEVSQEMDGGFESYMPAQIAKISKAADTVKSMRKTLTNVQPDIQLRNWDAVHDDVARLLPKLRQNIKSVTDNLKLSDRALARAVATEIFIHLERVDEADELQNYQAAEVNYTQALQDFDIFLTLLPTA